MSLGESASIKPEHILNLLREMNLTDELEQGLRVLSEKSLRLFAASMAGIWLKRAEKFELLAASAQSEISDVEPIQSHFASGLQAYWAAEGRTTCSMEKAVIHEVGVSGSDAVKWLTKEEWLTFDIRTILCIPLYHFGQLLGTFALFSIRPKIFGAETVFWIEQLVPLLSAFVYEHQMRLAAIEREQSLTLLLRGTEILVQADSEEQLLTEAGEMAMEILYLEAGFFLLHADDTWQIRAPFGRLRQKDIGWQSWVASQMKKEGPEYIPHEITTLSVLEMDSLVTPSPWPWRRILIQPIRTHRGVVAELWLLDSKEPSEQLRETLAAFVRGLGVALETIRQRYELERLATTDRLTGILNRQGFDQRIQEEMARASRRQTNFLLLILDLDRFKQLNDTEGHPTGDRALRAIAQNLKAAVRGQDIVARTGGDEFSVVLTELGKGSVAERIIERLRLNMHLENYNLGVSIGVAEYPTEAEDFEGLYRLADQRLYQGKNDGKGKIVFGID